MKLDFIKRWFGRKGPKVYKGRDMRIVINGHDMGHVTSIYMDHHWDPGVPRDNKTTVTVEMAAPGSEDIEGAIRSREELIRYKQVPHIVASYEIQVLKGNAVEFWFETLEQPGPREAVGRFLELKAEGWPVILIRHEAELCRDAVAENMHQGESP